METTEMEGYWLSQKIQAIPKGLIDCFNGGLFHRIDYELWTIIRLYKYKI